jgi:hypothetical protein
LGFEKEHKVASLNSQGGQNEDRKMFLLAKEKGPVNIQDLSLELT